MAKAKNKPNTDEPAEANPHFLGRHRPTQYNLQPALMQTAYPAHQMLMDFVRLTRERAESSGVKKEIRATLKNNAERFELAFKSFANLEEARQHELVAMAWASFHIGRVSDRLLQRSQLELEAAQKRAEAARASKAERDNKVHELGLTRANEMRRKHPTWSRTDIARRVVPWLIKQTNELYPGADYSIEVPTFAKWLGG
jgi:hypothetical protein